MLLLSFFNLEVILLRIFDVISSIDLPRRIWEVKSMRGRLTSDPLFPEAPRTVILQFISNQAFRGWYWIWPSEVHENKEKCDNHLVLLRGVGRCLDVQLVEFWHLLHVQNHCYYHSTKWDHSILGCITHNDVIHEEGSGIYTGISLTQPQYDVERTWLD